MTTAGRDLAEVAIPFAAGTAAGMAIAGLTGGAGLTLSACAASSVAFLLLAAVLFFHTKCRIAEGKWQFTRLSIEIPIRPTIILLLFATGASLCLGEAHMSPDLSPHAHFQGLAQRCRELIFSLPFPHGQTAPLLSAILTGDRSALDPATVETFRKSGAAHILALSGLHLGIIYGMVKALLAPLGKSRRSMWIKYIAGISFAGIYVLATGCGPSLVRAFLFIFLYESAAMSERSRKPLQIYLAALLMQLIMKPSSIGELSFQLSYLAVAGIVVLHPRIKRIYPGKGPLKKIWDTMSLSVSCQAFTAPLAWLRFHSFPQYFLLSNLIALPLTWILIVLAISTILLSATGSCPDFLILLTDHAASALVSALEIISGM